MTDRNIAAFTSSDPTYPQYLSINDRDGMVEFTVRSPADAGGNCGTTSAMRMTREQFKVIVQECGNRIGIPDK